jgi:hypothetical protein
MSAAQRAIEVRRGGIDGDHDIDLFHRPATSASYARRNPSAAGARDQWSLFLGARPGLQTENGDMQNFIRPA